ncbi:MAG: hypothetical protein AAFV69_01665 [Pseudomonadota bacterium]
MFEWRASKCLKTGGIGAVVLSLGLVLSVVGRSPSVMAQPAPECARGDFEAVVDEAGSALRSLNSANKPRFQAKLRELKDKRAWSHEAFLKNAATYVRDEKTNVFDASSQQLLAEIAELGQEGSEAAEPDCKLLMGLRERMMKLVSAQKEKWAYMFGKIEKALSE